MMVAETGDVRTFLAAHPPFNHLTEDQLAYASANATVAFSKSGSDLGFSLSDGGAPETGMLVVRSGSLEIRDNDGELIDRLSEGDYLVPELLFRHTGNPPQVSVLEDCLYYEIPGGAFRSLSAGNPDMAALTESKKHAVTEDRGTDTRKQQSFLQSSKASYLNEVVEDGMSSNLVSADRQDTIQHAARLMKDNRVSSLLILDDDELVGILTDRDFRVRVLADGVDPGEPLEKVMTASPMCIKADSRLHDAQIMMMSEGIHHLPVLRDKRPVGIITLSDILRANNTEPLSLVAAIKHADTIEELSEAAKGLPALMVKLAARDTRAVEVGKIVTAVADGIAKRLLQMAEDKFGSPPCAYAWLGFGSQARQEQVIGSDQDNGLLLPDGIGETNAAYFRDYAAFVNDGLDQCGIPYCPGEVMARNDKWRMTLQGWKDCFASWIQGGASPRAIMHASIFFDMRHIKGDATLTEALYTDVLEKAKHHTIFQAFMCENALLHSPPLGFFKTFVLESDGDHNNTLDLKKRGTIPIVDIARNYALAYGLRALNTIERLEALAETGAMSQEMSSSLIDAHEFIAGLRLEDQGNKFMAEQPVDNYLDPRQLSPLVRHHLKDAFSVVREAQAAMKARFSGGLL